jgi:hypothetical protein
LCEVAHLPAAGTTAVKKLEAWTHTQAAGLPLTWLTARTCIERVDPYVWGTPGKRLVVLGESSATGMYTIFIAKARGWTVLTSCSGRNADFVTNTMGTDEVIEYTVESVRDRVRAWKPDAIVDCVGGTECLGIAKRYVTIVGDKTARSTMGGSLLYLLYPRMVLRWLWGRFGWSERYDCIMLDQKEEYLEEAVRMLPVEKIMVDSTFAFEDAEKAFERLNAGKLYIWVKWASNLALFAAATLSHHGASFLPDTRSPLWKKPVSPRHSSHTVDFLAYTVDFFGYTVDFSDCSVDFSDCSVDFFDCSVDFSDCSVESYSYSNCSLYIVGR